MRASCLLILFVASTANAQPLSPRNANYTIDARLDARLRTITAAETIGWRNITEATATELQFHLYWNAWRDKRSTWMRELMLAGGWHRDFHPNDWSTIEVTSLTITAPYQADLTAAQRFIAPDDGNTNDSTVMAVALPQPVRPGSSITIDVKWNARIPRPVSRTGAIGNYFFIAQWFPKLGVLQNNGWNCHQFHASTEFFSDYGIYDVRLTVPQRWIVGATGRQRERTDNPDGTTTHHYFQPDVHDFVWTTSPDYLERTARFEHPTLPRVEMRLLLQPEHEGQADRHFDAARAALKYYGEWYGPYPYGHITIVDPAYQSDAGGMEYPTLFTAGSRWLAPAHGDTPEAVTIHEAGHQFWYGIVGNNEFEDAWMDEGINTFSTSRAIAHAYPPAYLVIRYFGGFVPWAFKNVEPSAESGAGRLSAYRRDAKTDAESTPSFRYFPSGGATITYFKTALWLDTMERWLGWPTLQRTLSTFFAKWAFKHPKPMDFFDAVTEAAGRDIGWFFDEVYRGSNVFDYGVQQITGSTAIVRRYGEAIFPVGVLITFENGERVKERWDGKERWHAFDYDGKSPIRSVEVDPDRVLLLDVNYTNNSKTTRSAAGPAARRWAASWAGWFEHCLLSWVALV